MRFSYFLGVLLLLSIGSCKQTCTSKAESIMDDWFKKKLIIPSNWVQINDSYIKSGNEFDFKNPNSKYYVLHYFDADCDKCIENLEVAKKFIDAKRKRFPNLKYVFVGTGATDIYLKEAVEKTKFNFPVYFEKKYLSFKKENKIPLDNENYYKTMLINSNNELILFGSLYDNKKAEDLYKDISNCQ